MMDPPPALECFYMYLFKQIYKTCKKHQEHLHKNGNLPRYPDVQSEVFTLMQLTNPQRWSFAKPTLHNVNFVTQYYTIHCQPLFKEKAPDLEKTITRYCQSFVERAFANGEIRTAENELKREDAKQEDSEMS